jgi:hypothetical protein
MNMTRRIRSLLAGSRRDPASVLTVMFLVLTVVGVQAVCSVHLDEAGHGAPHADAVVIQEQAVPGTASTQDPAVVSSPGHHGAGPDHCAEDRVVTARYDRTLSPVLDLATSPERTEPWFTCAPEREQRRVPKGMAVATAPSLHALGISRT